MAEVLPVVQSPHFSAFSGGTLKRHTPSPLGPSFLSPASATLVKPTAAVLPNLLSDEVAQLRQMTLFAATPTLHPVARAQKGYQEKVSRCKLTYVPFISFSQLQSMVRVPSSLRAAVSTNIPAMLHACTCILSQTAGGKKTASDLHAQ